MAVQADASILVGGYFTVLGGQTRNYIGRLNSDGSLNATFNPGAGGSVSSLAIQADGKVLVGGWFSSLAGTNRNGLGRLNNTAPPTQDLSYSSSKITWHRGATGPEVWRATFDASTNGATWTNVGSGVRISGGWQLTGVSLPTSATIRARGFIQGAQYSGSGWLVETNIGPLAINQQPLSRTNIAATLASFTVRAGGGSPPSYQWRKGGTNLADGPNLSGATAATLILSNAFGADAGAYSVVLNDGHTTLTSQVATLTVLDPFISAQPAGLTNNALTTATFTVTAVGQVPVTYSWLRNGTNLTDTANISGSHTSTLTLSNVLGGDAGGYSVVVSDASGSVTSLVASLIVVDPIITSQPVGQATSAGQSVALGVSAIGSAPISYQWLQGGLPLAGATTASLMFTNLQATNAGFYDGVVSNAYGVLTSAVVVLTVNYATADGLNSGVFSPVSSLALQPDGKIILGEQTGLVRLNLDGSWDNSWYSSVNSAVLALAILTNNATIFGGSFISVDSQNQRYLAHLNPGGSFDFGFNLAPDGVVRCLALRADGTIIVGGDFATLAGQPRSHLGRLLSDGSLDTNFNAGADGSVESLAVQPDGAILVGGSFATLNGQPCPRLGRLNANGTLDAAFNPGPNSDVLSLAVQPDGRILVGGAFTSLGGQPRSYLGRLNSGGSLDTSFNPGADNSVTCLALETDGRIIVGGTFGTLGGVPLNGLGRLNPNGTADLSFVPGGGPVYALALQKDGGVVVGGGFSMLAGQPRVGIGRLTATGPATENLAFDSSNVTWLRAGLGTEIWRATFELSTNGSTWAALGDGSRITGGWQLTGLVIPTNSIVRARGFAVGGSWFVETVAGLPVLTSQPVSLTNNATTTASFSVTAYGGIPLSYQWLKNGVSLNDGGNVSGAHTAALTLTNVLGADAGGYSVILSNATGSITSLVAGLTVVDPLLTSQPQPVSQTKNAGQAVTFSVTALGTAPLGFQWLRNGTNLNDAGNLSGAQTPSLVLTNVVGSNAGTYQAIVSNAWGSVTSQVATLTVVDPFIATNPASQAVQGGQAAAFSVTAAGAQPLSYQWRRNGAPVPNATNTSLNFSSAQGTNAGFYDVVVTSTFGSATSTMAALTVNLAAVDGFNPGANQVAALAVQPDGKVLVGVGPAVQGGVTSLLRFDPGGALDPGFNPGIVPAAINALAVQPDGEILVAGYAASFQRVLSLWRLNADGSADTVFTNNFNPNIDGTFYSLALQPDGRILAGGGFTISKPAVWTNLARINSDGTLDTNFIAGANSTIYSLAVQPNGAIVIGGNFATLSGQAHTRLGRFNNDGTLDTNFNATANSTVQCLLVQPDGKLLVGGLFTTLDGQSINHLGRLNLDGTLDSSFNPNANSTVYSLALQTDGKVLVAGSFTVLSGLARSRIGRLNPDGSLDLTFDPGAGGTVYSLAVQGDGAILAGGEFATLGGVARTNLGRLLNTDPATQSLTANASSVTWLRGGTSPEVWRTTFETSTNGVDWISLGAGQRVTGGWQLTGVSVPARAMIRARGFVSGGINNGSSWFVESVNPTVIAPEVLVADGGLGFHPALFGFNVRAVAGQVVVIEAATNFVWWTPIQTNLVTVSGLFQVTDPQSSGFPYRFYRARIYTGILPAPAMLAGGRNIGFTANGFGFDLTGVIGQTLIIECSTNLSAWTALATNTLESELLYFTDWGATNSSCRFYRLRLQ